MRIVIYEESVAKVKTLVYKWKNVTQDIIDELKIAREKLSVKPDSRERDTSGTFVPVAHTWEGYCEDTGVTKRTINRWLEMPHVALAQLGRMLKETERAKARFDEGNKKVPSSNELPTLADLGLDKKIS